MSDNKADYSKDDGESHDLDDVRLPHDWNIHQNFVREEAGLPVICRQVQGDYHCRWNNESINY